MLPARVRGDLSHKAANASMQVPGGMGLLTPHGPDRPRGRAQTLRIVDGIT